MRAPPAHGARNPSAPEPPTAKAPAGPAPQIRAAAAEFQRRRRAINDPALAIDQNALVLVVPWSIARIHSPAIYASRRNRSSAARSMPAAVNPKCSSRNSAVPVGRKRIGHAEDAHRRGMLHGKHLCYRPAQPARRQRFFRSHNSARGPGRIAQSPRDRAA